VNNTGLGVTRNSLHWDCLSLGRFLKRNESQGLRVKWSGSLLLEEGIRVLISCLSFLLMLELHSASSYASTFRQFLEKKY